VKTLFKAAIVAAAIALPGYALAQSQPPVSGPQDQACRDEARSKVMGGQVPAGMDMRTAGEGFYNDCMRRTASKAGGSKGKATKAKKTAKKRS
jgi:hypothetical protein